MKDKRQYIRIPESSELSYRLIPQSKTTGSISKDISTGGMRFSAREFIPIGSTLRIRLSIKNIPHTIDASVRVKWTKRISGGERYEIGAEFIEIPREGLLQLERYIRETGGEEKGPDDTTGDQRPPMK
jgi:c-di-GMP-binding flagellar brake protein YcgR